MICLLHIYYIRIPALLQSVQIWVGPLGKYAGMTYFNQPNCGGAHLSLSIEGIPSDYSVNLN